MKKVELDKLEKELKDRGYVKHVTSLSSNNDSEWIKVNKDENGEDSYLIIYRIWNFGNFTYNVIAPDNDYGVDNLIVLGAKTDRRIDVKFTMPVLPPSIIEEVAEKQYRLMMPYINNYLKEEQHVR